MCKEEGSSNGLRILRDEPPCSPMVNPARGPAPAGCMLYCFKGMGVVVACAKLLGRHVRIGQPLGLPVQRRM